MLAVMPGFSENDPSPGGRRGGPSGAVVAIVVVVVILFIVLHVAGVLGPGSH